jgi:hypothetical protein
MKVTIKRAATLLSALALTLLTGTASATNGYFTHGVGTESKGMAGSGVGSDGVSGPIMGASNPALSVFANDSWEIGLGGEYAVSDAVKITLGYLYSSIGVDPEFSSKFLPDLDAHTLGAGVKWMAMPQLAVNFAFGNVFYDGDSYVDTSLGTPIEIEYEKNIPFVALGIQYSF